MCLNAQCPCTPSLLFMLIYLVNIMNYIFSVLVGLHHQGIFRVSGSQVEINNFRENFERGEDPLADMTDASDINSVAGVLKLYLRELREPLFPIIYFDHLMELARELNGLVSFKFIKNGKITCIHFNIARTLYVVEHEVLTILACELCLFITRDLILLHILWHVFSFHCNVYFIFIFAS